MEVRVPYTSLYLLLLLESFTMCDVPFVCLPNPIITKDIPTSPSTVNSIRKLLVGRTAQGLRPYSTSSRPVKPTYSRRSLFTVFDVSPVLPRSSGTLHKFQTFSSVVPQRSFLTIYETKCQNFLVRRTIQYPPVSTLSPFWLLLR